MKVSAQRRLLGNDTADPDLEWFNYARAQAGLDNCLLAIDHMFSALDVGRREDTKQVVTRFPAWLASNDSDDPYRPDGPSIAPVPVVGAVQKTLRSGGSGATPCDHWMLKREIAADPPV